MLALLDEFGQRLAHPLCIETVSFDRRPEARGANGYAFTGSRTIALNPDLDGDHGLVRTLFHEACHHVWVQWGLGGELDLERWPRKPPIEAEGRALWQLRSEYWVQHCELGAEVLEPVAGFLQACGHPAAERYREVWETLTGERWSPLPLGLIHLHASEHPDVRKYAFAAGSGHDGWLHVTATLRSGASLRGLVDLQSSDPLSDTAPPEGAPYVGFVTSQRLERASQSAGLAEALRGVSMEPRLGGVDDDFVGLTLATRLDGPAHGFARRTDGRLQPLDEVCAVDFANTAQQPGHLYLVAGDGGALDVWEVEGVGPSP